MFARRFRLVRYRIFLLSVILFLVYTGSIQTFFHARHGISAKNLPTDLSSLDPDDSLLKNRLPPDGVVRFRASRYVDCATLGHGKEGHTSVCTDTYSPTGTQERVVVKRYYNDRDILRNAVPTWLREQMGEDEDVAARTWPVEIPASLLLNDIRAGQDDSQVAFVPIRDFFLDTECCLRPRWHAVTPLFERGSLEAFAEHIRNTSGYPTTPSELDEIYRPHFETILSSLAVLHTRGLCHDDVKPANIFIDASPHVGVHFILGDFGQLRETNHPYHRSRKWTIHGRQWTDCALNDTRRLLKTYLSFLRAASAQPDDFDDAFFLGRERWSSLYWTFLRSPVQAEELIRVSRENREKPSSNRRSGSPPGYIPLRLVASDRDVLRAAVSQELACKLLWVGESRLSDFAFAGWEIERPVGSHSEELKPWHAKQQ